MNIYDGSSPIFIHAALNGLWRKKESSGGKEELARAWSEHNIFSNEILKKITCKAHCI